MWAFIELLILADVYRAKNETLNILWSMINGRPIFRATMAKIILKAYFSFVDSTIEQRVKKD